MRIHLICDVLSIKQTGKSLLLHIMELHVYLKSVLKVFFRPEATLLQNL